MHKYFYLYLLLLSLVFAYCTPAKKELKKEEYKTVTTFWQIDSFPKSVYSIEQFNKDGKIISKTRFQLNFTLVPLFLESPFKPFHEIAYRQMENRSIFKQIMTERFNYDKKGQLVKSFLSYGLDFELRLYSYFPTKKIQGIKTIGKKMGTINSLYYYDEKDSLIRVVNYHEEKDEAITSDSIVCGLHHKKSYYLIDGEILEKNVTIYFNNKVMKELLYSGEPSKDENNLEIICRTKYVYNGRRLIKKIETNISRSEWSPIDGPGRINTFSFIYK